MGRKRHSRITDSFLPMSMDEAAQQGIREFDIILVSGDAYVDHPLFCTAVIGRVLQDEGYQVGVISQPTWTTNEDFARLGIPRLFFGVTAGNVDSMVNAYTAKGKHRKRDVYSPGGIQRRPDRATIVYTQRLHATFRDTPIVIGGIEASLRRFAHYDYWEDRVRQSILADAPADLLVFGMGESQVIEIARRLDQGEAITTIQDIPGTMVTLDLGEWRKNRPVIDCCEIPGYSAVAKDRRAYAEAFAMHYREQDPFRGRPVVQTHPKTVVIQNPPAQPLTTEELDHIYELPYTRNAHPSYTSEIPALAPVKFSVVSHRGCFGGCAFCALTHHQGRIIQNRSIASIVREVEGFTRMMEFRGVVQDIGGPTANMFGLQCVRWEEGDPCSDRQCSTSCNSLKSALRKEVELLRRIRQIPGVKKVFVGSGIRHDLVDTDALPWLDELCRYHISGHLKVAPEHIVEKVTSCMNKPGKQSFEEFRKMFDTITKTMGKKQYLLPYFMSGHPTCTIDDMIELAEYLRDHHLYTEQVQDFTPTPMTASTTMYHTGFNPFTMEPVHIPKGREKMIQRALLHYRDPRNYFLVKEGLILAGRRDLIGDAWQCLIRRRSPS